MNSLIRRCAVIITTAIVLSTAPASAQDAGRGKEVYKRCSSCHVSSPTAQAGFGPTLWKVVGRRVGGVPGYSYSPAMKAASFPWSVSKLNAFIAKPAAAVPGNKMPFGGIADSKDRQDLVAYLMTLTTPR